MHALPTGVSPPADDHHFHTKVLNISSEHVKINTGASNHYLLTAEDGSGKRAVRRVIANSADEAINKLKMQGLHSISLLTDDMSPPTLISPQALRQQRAHLTPAEHAKMGKTSPGNYYLWLVKRGFVALATPALLVALVFVWRRWHSIPWGWPEVIAGCLFIFPFAAAWYFSRGSRVYRRIQVENLRNRHDRVIKLLPSLKRSMRPQGEAAATLTVTRLHANALARLGRPKEALDKIDTIRTIPGMTDHQYHLMRADVIMTIRDYAAALVEYDRSINADPTKPLAWVGAAEVLALYLNRPAEARIYLDSARQFPLSEDSERMIRCVEATIDLLEGRAAKSRATLEEVLPHFERLARFTPMVRGFVMVLQSVLCRACAASGDQLAARRHFDIAAPFLELHQHQALLEPCRKALAVHQKP